MYVQSYGMPVFSCCGLLSTYILLCRYLGTILHNDVVTAEPRRESLHFKIMLDLESNEADPVVISSSKTSFHHLQDVYVLKSFLA